MERTTRLHISLEGGGDECSLEEGKELAIPKATGSTTKISIKRYSPLSNDVAWPYRSRTLKYCGEKEEGEGKEES